eukprot:XP_014768129.1 PREDICTED: tumor protein p53-inducible protein 11-like isoform X7 [Octopus bimaculoides]
MHICCKVQHFGIVVSASVLFTTNARIVSNRKHSSGDLHSRLKSRKLLGVGETDDGDIHRSKLSQILGHSDQLYVRLPSGLRVWQFTLALVFTVIAVWALVFPQHLYETAFEAVEGQCLTLPVRFYGAALLSLSWLFWSTLHAIDRDVIKTALITSILYFFAHVLVTSVFMMLSTLANTTSPILLLLSAITIISPSCYFYWAVSKEGRTKEGQGYHRFQVLFY